MRRLAMLGVLAACCVACGSPVSTADSIVTRVPPALSSTSLPAPNTTTNTENQIRVEIADGCPASLAAHHEDNGTAANWIANPDPTRLDTTFVPGTPTSALICRYAAMYVTTTAADGRKLDGGAVFSTTTLDAATAATLATALDDIVPWNFVAGCQAGPQHARYTAIVFAIPGRSDVDLWLKDWVGCPEVGNGARTSGLLVNGQGAAFLAQLDAAAPPAPPTEDFASTT
jgi:hypothetical protein